MEISSFPFPSSEDFSQLYYSSSTSPPPPPFPDLESGTPTKRHRKDNHNDDNNNKNDDDESVKSGTTIKEILSSLLMFDETGDEFLIPFQQENSLAHMSSPNYYDHQIQTQPEPEPEPEPESESPVSKQRNKRTRGSPTSSSSVVGSSGGSHRRLWVKDRSKDWWEKCSHPDFPEEEFKKAFRMSKSTFEMICDELDPIITKKDTMLRAAIPVRQRVAVCIWRLATGEPLRLVSKRFGLGISTCHKLVLEVCAAIKTALMPKFIQWPDPTRLEKIKQEFESMSGIPNVGGSMYTTHIPIIAPKISVAAYFNKRHTERNQKTSYSITVQGVVDRNGVFTDVCIGWPGSMPDDQVLEKSALYERATRGEFNNVWVVGTNGFPLMDWILVPYTHQHLTWTQHAFNEKIGDIQKTARGAFWRLKARWGCLQKRTEVKLQDLPVVLGACCVLHNICEMKKEEMDPDVERSFELFDDDMVPENGVRSAGALQARDHIAHNLLHHGLAGTSFL